MLADKVDHVIGVDTHRDAHSAAIVNPAGAVEADSALATDAFGYRRLLRFAYERAPGRRVWTIEGTGSFWLGPYHVPARAQRVGRRDRPPKAPRAPRRREVGRARCRSRRPRGAFARAPRTVAPARLAGGAAGAARHPRRGDRPAHQSDRAAQGLIVSVPAPLRDQLRRRSTDEQLARCARLRTGAAQSVEHRATVVAIRAAARWALAVRTDQVVPGQLA